MTFRHLQGNAWPSQLGAWKLLKVMDSCCLQRRRHTPTDPVISSPVQAAVAHGSDALHTPTGSLSWVKNANIRNNKLIARVYLFQPQKIFIGPYNCIVLCQVLEKHELVDLVLRLVLMKAIANGIKISFSVSWTSSTFEIYPELVPAMLSLPDFVPWIKLWILFFKAPPKPSKNPFLCPGAPKE